MLLEDQDQTSGKQLLHSNFSSICSLLFLNPLDNTQPAHVSDDVEFETRCEGGSSLGCLQALFDGHPWHIRTQMKASWEEPMKSPNKALPLFHYPVLRTDLFPQRGLQKAVLEDETVM